MESATAHRRSEVTRRDALTQRGTGLVAVTLSTVFLDGCGYDRFWRVSRTSTMYAVCR
jgi:hypothetical protein